METKSIFCSVAAASNNTSNKREERGEPRDREKARDRYYGENN